MAESMRDILNPGLAAGADKAFPHAPEDWGRTDGEQAAREEGLEDDRGPRGLTGRGASATGTP